MKFPRHDLKRQHHGGKLSKFVQHLKLQLEQQHHGGKFGEALQDERTRYLKLVGEFIVTRQISEPSLYFFPKFF